MKPRIIIQVQGGLVQDITSDHYCDIYLLDWDNIKETAALDMAGLEPAPPDEILAPKEFGGRLADLLSQAEAIIDKNKAYEKDQND